MIARLNRASPGISMAVRMAADEVNISFANNHDH